jgi:hypothetical protein
VQHPGPSIYDHPRTTRRVRALPAPIIVIPPFRILLPWVTPPDLIDARRSPFVFSFQPYFQPALRYLSWPGAQLGSRWYNRTASFLLLSLPRLTQGLVLLQYRCRHQTTWVQYQHRGPFLSRYPVGQERVCPVLTCPGDYPNYINPGDGGCSCLLCIHSRNFTVH